MSANGQLPASMLHDIPGGRLTKNAAAAWNAGPAKAGCRPLGPNSSYRIFAMQVFFWNNQPPLAARPGSSNHGWGTAIDLQAPWMRSWIDQHGARYGWRKVEAMSEWWHVNYVGGFRPPPSPMRFIKGKKRHRANLLQYHRRRAKEEAKTGKGRRYRRHVKWRNHYRKLVVKDWRASRGREKRALTRVLKAKDGRL